MSPDDSRKKPKTSVVYEIIDRATGDIIAIMEAPHDQRAAFRLRFELAAEGIDDSWLLLRQAPDQTLHQVATAVSHWLPYGVNGKIKPRKDPPNG